MTVRSALGICAAASLALALAGWMALSLSSAAAEERALIRELRTRVEAEHATHERLAAELATLRASLDELASRPRSAQLAPAPTPPPVSAERAGAAHDRAAAHAPADVDAANTTFDEASLVQIGVAPGEVARLRARFDRAERQRADARDEETRRRIDRSLRAELGDDAYDQLLFGARQVNRIRVDGVYPGSPAEAAGLRAGDLIRRYAGQTVYQPSDLRALSLQATRGERVAVQVERNGQLLNLSVEAGPLGAPLRAMSIAP